MDIITYARSVGLQIYYELSYVLCLFYIYMHWQINVKLLIVILNFVYLIKKLVFVWNKHYTMV